MIYDFFKLVSKEMIILNIVNYMFRVVFVLVLVIVIVFFVYMLMGFMLILVSKGDVIVFIYFLIFISFFKMFGVISLGNLYVKIGVVREVMIMVLRELVMMLVIFIIMWCIGKFGVEEFFSMGIFY